MAEMTLTTTEDASPVRDPMTGRLLPGARLPNGGNPIARLQYAHRKRFLDAVTSEELDKARDGLLSDLFDDNAKVRQAARAQYFDMVYGKATQVHEIGRADEAPGRSDVEDKLGRVLDALTDHPEVRSKVADILLGGAGEPSLEVIATIVTTEVTTNGQGN